ncbi:amidohydrolase family protein [Sphingomonas sp. AOB5]|uniref:amidohydrolase family protein n=1 Tax=Sphingomonas sp. AOB5 TaxID=3034017 RepID=UPI0023F66B51|nr:amidohydrolase family protein [Sphingomonas sp. AOB5]MDF7775614.1 amidohydrolase family protein [Sphingomonas sp. AOB5]
MRNGYKAIDVDLHIMEPLDLWEKRLPEPYRSATRYHAPGGVEMHGNYELGVGDQKWIVKSPIISGQAKRRWADPAAKHLLDFNRHPTPELMLEGMAAEGLDVAAIIPSMTFQLTSADNADPKHILAICRAYNDWIAEFCSQHRDRLRFWAWVPRHDAELAAEEANRCVKELGADGVAMTLGAVGGRLLTDPHFEQLWTETENLGVPFGLHVWGANATLADDTGRRYWKQPSGFGIGSIFSGILQGMSSVPELIYSGVLERHPGLRVLTMETGNTWLIYLLDRMDEKWEKYEQEIGETYGVKLSMPPSEYFKRQCYVTCEGEEKGLNYLLDMGLADNLTFSTDYPHHDSPWPLATQNFLDQELGDEANRKILWENSLDLFKWRDLPDGTCADAGQASEKAA